MNEKLLRYLLEQQLLTAEQADELRRAQEETNKSIRELILERAILPEEQVIEALSSLTRTPVVHLYEMTIPMDVRQAVRPDILRTYTMMPFQFDPEDSGTLYVAMNEPMNMKGRDMVAIASKCRIKPFLATTSDILVTIDRCYGSEEMQEAAELYTQTNERESASLEDQVFQEDVNASPVVVLVNSLVEQAVRQRASDIHVESGPDKVRVRCRVDGVLYTTATYDLQLLPAIIARIKILSNLDISEKRRPQDGRFSILVDRREYDVRVSTLPTVYGEKCVMRLTQKKALRRSKRALGLTGSELEKFDEILRHPNGIVLVTGPTGSGKSTTLYTALNELNSDMVNIVTVEDPVEANVDGVNQVQVNPKANLTFGNALRSILRQDPDIIMIGEIRDRETASIAVQASITGHLVVSTLHTNDTASSVTRLLDMGVCKAQRAQRGGCIRCVHDLPCIHADVRPPELHDFRMLSGGAHSHRGADASALPHARAGAALLCPPALAPVAQGALRQRAGHDLSHLYDLLRHFPLRDRDAPLLGPNEQHSACFPSLGAAVAGDRHQHLRRITKEREKNWRTTEWLNELAGALCRCS